jgi:hypothetical protein
MRLRTSTLDRALAVKMAGHADRQAEAPPSDFEI